MGSMKYDWMAGTGHAPSTREASDTPRMIEHPVPVFYAGGVEPLFAQAQGTKYPRLHRNSLDTPWVGITYYSSLPGNIQRLEVSAKRMFSRVDDAGFEPATSAV